MADDETTEEAGESGGRRWLLIIAIASVALLAGAGGATFFVMTRAPDAETAADSDAGDSDGDGAAASADGEGDSAAKAASGPVTFALEPMIVNIFDGERDRFLKLTVNLEVSSEAVHTELTDRLAQVKDLMISVVSAQTYADVRSPDGKVALREQLHTRFNAMLQTGVVNQVFFTDFIVQ